MERQNLSIRKVIVGFFALVFTLALVNIFTIRYFQNKQEKDSLLVDISGRNRMLSQKIGFYTKIVAQGDESAKKHLLGSISLHNESLRVLKDGGRPPGSVEDIDLPKATETILTQIKRVESLWSKYKTNAEVVLNLKTGETTANDSTQSRINSAVVFIEANAQKMLKVNNDLVQVYVAMNYQKKAQLNRTLIILLLTNMLILLGAYFTGNKFLILPIKKISKSAGNIASGNMSEKLPTHYDPYVNKLVGSINTLRNNLDQSAKFAKSIGEGDFDNEILSDNLDNSLFNELSNMRDKLLKVTNEDKKRNWSTEGLTMFGRISRAYQHDMGELCNEVISNLVKYLNLNQGGIFVLQEDKAEESYLELKACYAWERKKYLTKKISQGEGLVGQCWLEQDIIYMTDIPDDYINITSGLGASTPKCILLAPLKTNESLLGVIEIAGFNELEDYQIKFIERVCETIASTISLAQINKKTEVLLEESQSQSDQMVQQEEEIRQHMEEMQATQEEMERNNEALEAKVEAINTSIGVAEFDKDGYLINANELFIKSLKYNDISALSGKHRSEFLVNCHTVPDQKNNFWDQLLTVGTFKEEFKRKTKDNGSLWLKEHYVTLQDHDQEMSTVTLFTIDITSSKATDKYSPVFKLTLDNLSN